MTEMLDSFYAMVSTPQWGLGVLVFICFLSSTLLPLSSEPALLVYLELNPEHFWLAIALASLGNTLGGALNFWLGAKSLSLLESTKGDHAALEKSRKISQKLRTFGPQLLLLSWLPIVGDPMCLVAGFLKFPVLSSIMYIAVGKYLRYLVFSLGFLSLESYWGPYLKSWLIAFWGLLNH